MHTLRTVNSSTSSTNTISEPKCQANTNYIIFSLKYRLIGRWNIRLRIARYLFSVQLISSKAFFDAPKMFFCQAPVAFHQIAFLSHFFQFNYKGKGTILYVENGGSTQGTRLNTEKEVVIISLFPPFFLLSTPSTKKEKRYSNGIMSYSNLIIVRTVGTREYKREDE